ncbi:MAG: 4a-hydroxytetrahydrobiopterin dehydratase [Acidobacteriota bacterium]
MDMEAALRNLPGWTVVAGKLHREYRFADFAGAFSFMTAGALRAEAMNHHPEWSNVYNRVTVDLVTHSANGITAKDLDLATKFEEIARKLQ